MWSKFVRFLKGDKRPVTAFVPNGTLGVLSYSHDDACWVTAESNATLPLRIFIAGNWDESYKEISPDRRLIEHAESVARAPGSFLDAVADLLRSELKTRGYLKRWEEEVVKLKVSALHLPWAKRPGDGMIEFNVRISFGFGDATMLIASLQDRSCSTTSVFAPSHN